ncbi:deoxyribose-phosphate aldolase [Rathayibacter toxicus]|uniref:Deoxyribose-phosphate aldolase n=1 Tax=Rathayibacter toxicus TaxID=145458 RepID=A0A0C5BFT7_9MICO|nr:deoxyribose-phosphate aldolase [Rathayibacter toxicus]AJM77025.1 deoxyribose-phosphate aldolase [Rathayibacter toxicus]ALS57171.1 2-deoxyribose-5-phosphate aldolase [Rathayibacter toxicus]KKM46404.1 deoxyribose-phosphate aldolase [Rathayibacter toxicus]PPG22955.1 deoxyribose-phosphate aldolase [Rathayibacter toxicus]PPG47536.1 deoxyribose-phosphate aldolase [Rathayibacter toxicus]
MSENTQSFPSVPEIAALIDHAVLRPELSRADVDAQLDEARTLGVFSACVRPCDVAHAARRLEDSGTAVGTVIGFPHGTTSTAAKVAEARQALADGAVELDMVVNIGGLRSGAFQEEVEDDIRAVVAAADGHVLKVILETSYLNDDQIVAGCTAAERAGAEFVKTATGFGPGGATEHALRVMRAAVSDAVQIKASGGVRDLDTLLAYRALGVTRFGTSGSATILRDVAARLRGDSVAVRIDSASY